jgi:hypothetical protein
MRFGALAASLYMPKNPVRFGNLLERALLPPAGSCRRGTRGIHEIGAVCQDDQIAWYGHA